MSELNSILAVSLILWSGIVLYLAYLDSRLRRLQEKVEGLRK